MKTTAPAEVGELPYRLRQEPPVSAIKEGLAENERERLALLETGLPLAVLSIEADGIISDAAGQGLHYMGRTVASLQNQPLDMAFADCLELLVLVQAAWEGNPGAEGNHRLEIHDHVWDCSLRTVTTTREGRIQRRVHIFLLQATSQHRDEGHLRRLYHQAMALNTVAAAVASTLHFESALQILQVQLDSQFAFSGGALYMANSPEEEMTLRSDWGLTGELAERTGAYLHLCCAKGESLSAPHFWQELYGVSGSERQAGEASNWRSAYCLPLLYGGRTLGALFLFSTDPRGFSQYERPFFELLGQQIGTALQNAWLHTLVEKKRLQLQHLARTLVETQESERRFLARELYQDLGQALSGLKDSLALYDAPGLALEDQQNFLTEARQAVSDLLSRVRDRADRLHPTILEDLGLLPALRWYLEAIQQQSGALVELRCLSGDIPRLERSVEAAAFRLVQEALATLTVAPRPAHLLVTVALAEDSLQLALEKESGGVRYPGEGTTAEDGEYRFAGLYERAQAAHGSIWIRSSSEGGVRVEVSLPCQPVTFE